MKVKLNESQLNKIIAESVKRILKEADVVRGTNINIDREHSENDMAPDFVQTMANRLENFLNKSVEKEANEVEWFSRSNWKPFTVIAHMDNYEDKSYGGDFFINYSEFTDRVIVFDVDTDRNIRLLCKPLQVRNLIHNAAYKLFGAMEDLDDMIFDLDGADGGGQVKIIFMDEEYSKANTRFKNNPMRQIKKKGSTFNSEED